MSSAQDVSSALNKWSREGLDLFSGPDNHAFQALLEDYFCGDDELPEGKSGNCLLVEIEIH